MCPGRCSTSTPSWRSKAQRRRTKGRRRTTRLRKTRGRAQPAPLKTETAMTDGRQPILTMTGISKAFGGSRALMDVDLDLYPGEVLAIVGDNGAGKSTLIKVLTGVYRADTGAICIEGRPVAIANRRDIIEAGISPPSIKTWALSIASRPMRTCFSGRSRCAVFSASLSSTTGACARRRSASCGSASGSSRPISTTLREVISAASDRRSPSRAVFSIDLKVLVMDEPTAAGGPGGGVVIHAARGAGHDRRRRRRRHGRRMTARRAPDRRARP